MPVTVELIHNERVILCTWTAPITPTDFAEAFEILGNVYRHAHQPVHTIFDATGITLLPSNTISTFLHNESSPLRHMNSGVMIGVTTNAFVRIVAETAAKMRPHGKLLLVGTLNEAVTHIESLLNADSAEQVQDAAD